MHVRRSDVRNRAWQPWILMLCTLVPRLAGTQPSVDDERTAVRKQLSVRLPDLPWSEYGRDAAALGATSSVQSDARLGSMIANGAKLYGTHQAGGRSYSNCLPLDARLHFPRFDAGRGEVETLSQVVVRCQSRNNSETYAYGSTELAELEAYLSQTVQGKPLAIDFPEHDTRAADWYEKGRFLFHAKRGQMNLSCADCHVANAGGHLRGETLGPSLSHALRFPIYLQRAAKLRSLHEQYRICSARVRAKPFELQSPEYRALEWYEALMSKDLPVSAPAVEP